MKRSIKKTAIIIIIILVLLPLIGYGGLKLSSSRTFQFFGRIVSRIDTQEKVVALTFDDGPSEHTDEILSVLSSEGVKATFFLNGAQIKKFPDLAQKIASAGHEIGNHTYSHKRMVLKSWGFIKKEIESTDELIREGGYTGEIHFRPPNGKKLLLLPYYLSRNNRLTIMWNLEPNSIPEISSDSAAITRYVIDNAAPGSIILLHPMYDQYSRDALRDLIKGLKDKGYEFKTVSEMLDLN
ncbi:MAG TPA: polysaccharide deacetylase family protein [Clostridia bacterium]|nr:polysaccharide deacetylase family protein [Clostridia bacterium]